MSRANSIFKNALLMTLSSLLMRTAHMSFQVYLSGRIGAEGIGLFQLVLTVYSLAVTIGISGIRVTTTVLASEQIGLRRPGGVHRVMVNCMAYALVLSCLSAGLFYYFSDFICQTWIGDERALLSLKLMNLGLPFVCLSSVIGGYFTATGKIGRYVTIEIIERFLSIIITVLLLKKYAHLGISHSIAAIFAGSAIANFLGFSMQLFLFYMDGRRLRRSAKGGSVLKRMLSMALPIAVNDYARSGLNTVENMLIPRGLRQYGGSAETSLASYGTIHGMVFPIIMFPATILYSLSQLLVPEIAASRSAGNSLRVDSIVSRVLNLGLIFAFGIAGGLLLLSNQLGRLIYGSSEVSYFIRVFAPMVVVLYVDALTDGMLKGLGQHVYTARYNTITSLLDVVLLFLLLPRYGIDGYFFVFVLTHLFNFYLSLGRLIKSSRLSLSLGYVFKVSACVCAAAALSHVSAALLGGIPLFAETVIKGLILLVCYWTLLLFTSAVRREELVYLKSVFFGTGKSQR